MASSSHTDILIIGGGIAGLALAALLGRAGISARLAEPSPPPPLKDVKPAGRTIALMDSSLNIIKATGAWELAAPFSNPLETMRIVDDSRGDDRIEIEFPATDIGLQQFGFNVPNAILRAALYETLRGIKNVTVEIGTLEGFEVSDTSVTATLKDQAVTASLIIGADGRNSRVREISGIEATDRDYGQKAITCLINHSRSHNNVSTEFHRPAGPFALVPLPGNQSAVVWVENAERADQLIALKRDDFALALQAQTQDILGGITLETGPECWPLHSIKAQAITAPRTAIMAEAAHVMSPITAQGLNLSLRDVAALAETIVDAMRVGLDPGTKVILDKYARRRRLDMNTRVFGVDGLNRIVSTDAALIRGVRRAGLKTLDAIPALKNLAMQTGLAPRLDLGRLAKGEVL